jgi:hypothetical protein
MNEPGDEEPPGPAATSLSVTGDSDAQTTDGAVLSATLTTADGPVAGKEIAFSLAGTPVGTGTTDADGVASVAITVEGAAREAVQSATFAGDDGHAASAVTAPFSVTQEDSSLTLGLAKSKRDHSGTATLAEPDGVLAGQTVRFFVDGVEVGSATTDGQGVATLVLGKLKDGTVVTAVFDPTSTYLGSSAQQQVVR